MMRRESFPLVLRAAAVFFLFLGFFAAPALPAPPEAASAAEWDDRFAAMDTDGDNGLSPAEFAAGFPHMREAAFSAMDSDRDGLISREEWRRVRSGHMSPAPGSASLSPGDPAAGGAPPSGPGGGNGTVRGPDLILPRSGNAP